MWFMEVSEAAVLYYGGLTLTLIDQEMFDMLLACSKCAAKSLNVDAHRYFHGFCPGF